MLVNPNFDTLEYADELKGAGMDPRMAEAQARAMKRVMGNFVDANKDKVATQDDLTLAKTELKHEIESVRSELKHDIETVRSELKSDVAAVRTELLEVKAELKQDIALVRQDMLAMENRLIKSMSKIVFGGFSIFGLVVIALHYFKIML